METITELKVGCPHCGYSKWVDARHSGAKARCPNCDGEFRVPRAPRSKRPPTSQPPTSRAPSSLAPASAANSDEAFEKTERAANARTPLRLSGAGRTPRKASHSVPREAELPEVDDLAEADPLLDELERSDAAARAGGPSREELIDYEGHLRAIALWNRLPGLLTLLLGILGQEPVAIPVGATMLYGGVKLARMHEAGRATIAYLSLLQVLISALALLTLVGGEQMNLPAALQITVGIAYFVFQFKFLSDKRAKQICSEPYRAQIEADGYPAPYLHSPFFIGPAILFGFLVLGMVLTALRAS